MNSLHICVFSTVHPWDDVRVKSKLVDSWLDRGDSVTWVGPDRALFGADAVRDERVKYFLDRSTGSRRDRLLSLTRLRSTLAQVPSIDWVYCPDPDAMWIAQSVGNFRTLLDVHEEYHKSQLVQSLPDPLRPIASRAVRAIIRRIARKCDLVTGVNETVLDAYAVPSAKRLVTMNTPPAWFAAAEIDRTAGEGSSNLRIFHGKAHSYNGTLLVLRALALLQADKRPYRVVMFPSPGTRESAPYDPQFVETVASLGVDDLLDLRDGVPHHQMPLVMGSTSMGLIAYDRVLGEGSLPNRFFEYLAIGVVPIVPTYSPLMRRFCDEFGVGLTADFEKAQSVANAIRWCAQNPTEVEAMSKRGRQLFRESLAWEQIFDALAQRMRSLGP